MPLRDVIHLRAGDTEPIEIIVGATGLSDLSALTTATFYARKEGATANHVTAGTMTTVSSPAKTLSFDPLNQKVGGGNAFDAAGTYDCYVKLLMSDGDITRHPGKEDYLQVIVTEHFE